MISDFHIEQIKKRFPNTYAKFVEDGCADTWEDLMEWLEYNGQKSNYYAVGMGKMEIKL